MSIWGEVACFLGISSEAREKAKKYEKVEKQLTEKIEKIESNLMTVEDALKEVDDTFVNGNGEAEGKIMTTFTDREMVWSGKYKEIIMEMKNGIACLRMRKAEVAQRRAYWEMQAEIEEMKANG